MYKIPRLPYGEAVRSAEQVRNQLDLSTEKALPGLIRVLQLEQVLGFVGAVRAVHTSAAVRVGRRQGRKFRQPGSRRHGSPDAVFAHSGSILHFDRCLPGYANKQTRQHTVSEPASERAQWLDNAAIGLALCTVSWRYRRRQECRLNTGPTRLDGVHRFGRAGEI
jgi:hypothetical protein